MDDHRERLALLVRMGARRGAPAVQPEIIADFVQELADIPLPVLRSVCDKLGRAEVAEYESKFPALGTILAKCRLEQRQRQIEAPRVAPLYEQFPPISETQPEKWAHIKAQFQAICRRKRMP